MIQYVTTSIFESNADALVVPVDTDGVMGAGLAKAFACRYPDLEREYALCCTQHRLTIGSIFVYSNPEHSVEPTVLRRVSADQKTLAPPTRSTRMSKQVFRSSPNTIPPSTSRALPFLNLAADSAGWTGNTSDR